MKYTETEVLDILKFAKIEECEKIMEDYRNQKSNVLLDLNERKFNHFVYTFPVVIDGTHVVDITLVNLYGGDLNSLEPNLMLKYFGDEKYQKSWWSFSHDTYLSCYLTIYKDFKLVPVVEGFYLQNFVGKDSEGKDFNFTLSYGYPDKEQEEYLYGYEKTYRFDNDVSLNVDKNISGWLLGEKINENINNRCNKNDQS